MVLVDEGPFFQDAMNKRLEALFKASFSQVGMALQPAVGVGQALKI